MYEMQDARLDRYEVFVAPALVAAHAERRDLGFRHRDVKFVIELFSNWVESSLQGVVLEVQNSQVARYLAGLTAEGYARRITRKGYPRYRLTRVGLVELMSRAVSKSCVAQREHFFFLYYFVTSYSARVHELVEAEGRQFPVALKLELEDLLDPAALVKREIEAVRRELAKVEQRIHDSLSTSKLVQRFLRERRPLEEAVAEVQRRYPYELNSVKPLAELIAEVPPDLREWELTEGNERRAAQIWRPAEAMLRSYLAQLESLSARSAEVPSAKAQRHGFLGDR